MKDEINIKMPGQILDYVDTKKHLLELFNHITNLQQKVDQYENPDDMTLMFMWCDEKAKDKIKQLQEEIERLNNIIDELEKWLEDLDKYTTTMSSVIYIDNMREKLKELKEGK